MNKYLVTYSPYSIVFVSILNASFFSGMIEDLKSVLKLLNLPAAETLHQLEHYRISHDKDGVKPYLEKESDPMKLINPLVYWRYFSTPELFLLKKLAEVIYAILSSSSICETNFRDYEYIMDKRRLRLKPNLAEKLVFIYCNKRIKM